MKKLLIDDPLAPIAQGITKVEPLLRVSFGPDKGTVFCGGKVVSLYSSLLSYIRHDDHFENIAIKLIEDTANDVYSKAGSGVSLASILTVGLVRNAHKLITAGYHPRQVHDWMQMMGADFTEFLKAEVAEVKALSWKGNERKILQRIAITSLKDEVVGTLIGDMCHKIGEFAHVDILQDDIPDVRVEYRNGFTFPTNQLSFQFLKGKRKEFINPKILISGKQLDSVPEMVEIMRAANKDEAPLIILAPSVSRDIMSLFLHNLNIGSLDIMALKSPYFGSDQHDALQDISQISGGSVIDIANWNAAPAHLGVVPRAVVGKDYCTLYFKDPVPEVYIAPILKNAETAITNAGVLRHRQRASNLRGLAAVLSVGGYTDKEKKSRYYSVESALHCVRGAQQEGYLPGGYQIFRKFVAYKSRPEIPTPLYDGMVYPYNALMSNYTGDVPSYLQETDAPGCMFDIKLGRICTLKESGVIDSAKSIRVATESAISIAKTLATTGAIVAEV